MTTNSAIKRGLFFCTLERSLAQKFRCLETLVPLRKVDVSGDFPKEISGEEPVWIKATFDSTSQGIIKNRGMYCWLIESGTETEITEKGIKYATIAFQIEEYSSGLRRLADRLNAQSIGLRIWKSASVSRFVSEAGYLIRLIDHEISQMNGFRSLPQELKKAINDLKELLDTTAVIVDRKKGYIEAENRKIDFYYFILGIIIGLIPFLLSLFLGFV